MSRIAENIIKEVKKTQKESLTQDEIFGLVLRVAKDTQIKFIECGGIKLDRTDMTVSVNGKKTKLPKTDFELLVYLIENKNTNVERDVLIRDVWGTNVIIGSRTLDVSICKLRKIIGKEKIKTICHVGYYFVE